MKVCDIAASLALHAAVIGAAVYGLSHAGSPPAPDSVPVYFEIVEEAAAEEVARATPKPQPQPVEPLRTVSPQGLDAPSPLEPPPPEAAAGPAAPSSAPEAEAAPRAAVLPPPLDTFAAPPAEEDRAQVRTAAPQPLGRIVPVYPRNARRKGHEGEVSLAVLVAADGGVAAAEVLASSGHDELDQAALQAARTAHFAPATADGAAIEGRIVLTFDFRLRQGGR